jgi:hypothetical protein
MRVRGAGSVDSITVTTGSSASGVHLARFRFEPVQPDGGNRG